MRYVLSLCIVAAVAISTIHLSVHGQTLESGPQVLTFFSDVDDTDQPYAIYLPPDFDETRSYPLVVSLHGAGSNHRLNLRRIFGKSNLEGENDVEASRYFPDWEDVEYIVAAPLARGTMGYQGVAEKDVLDVLSDVKSRFPIDENRTYLTGLSMGGGGALWLGLTRPDLWAAIAPVCPAPPQGTRQLASNALNTPVHIFQGAADPVVQPEGVREWVSLFDSLGTSIEYEEYPGVGHDSWVQAYDDGQIFDWFDNHERDPYPDRVRFVSEAHEYGQAYWVTLDALTPGTPAEIDARFLETNKVHITTSNLHGFTLHLNGHPLYNSDQPLRLTLDRETLEVSDDASPSFSFRDDRWKVGNPIQQAKRAGREGPLGEAISDRHIYVFGTGGNPTEEEMEKRRAQAMRAANWSIYRGPFWDRVKVFPRVVSDQEVRPSDLESAHLVLFGTTATNSIIDRFSEELPIHLNEGTDDIGLVYIYPVEEGRYVVVNSGLPWWEAEADSPGSPFTDSIVSFQLNDLADYLVFDGSSGNVISQGRFDTEWHIPSDDADLLRESGAVDVSSSHTTFQEN